MSNAGIVPLNIIPGEYLIIYWLIPPTEKDMGVLYVRKSSCNVAITTSPIPQTSWNIGLNNAPPNICIWVCWYYKIKQ